MSIEHLIHQGKALCKPLAEFEYFNNNLFLFVILFWHMSGTALLSVFLVDRLFETFPYSGTMSAII